MKLTYESEPRQEDIDILSQGISEYAYLKKRQQPIESFAFFFSVMQMNLLLVAVMAVCIMAVSILINYGWMSVTENKELESN
ncbi:hypothetical protein [Legionella septentrionalis]|uniref:hypothetical protein n=1 Tax=Legionella septentrionalis TaxID=2498109 RepID=UPI001F30EDB9|nr:hypothetical protein [Legionella septentrionalis]